MLSQDLLRVGDPSNSEEKTEPILPPAQFAKAPKPNWSMFALGLALTVALGAVAFLLVPLPGLTMLGSLTIALILGLVWRAIFGLPQKLRGGVRFSAQKILRYGIILTGVRLNFQLLASSGIQILLLDTLLITFGLLILPRLAQKLGLSRRLALLLGIGQSICGASAVGAISALIPGVEEDEVSLAVALCGLVGTMGVLFFTFAEPFLHLSSHFYGVLAGSTLHEIAQVVAAGPAGGPVAAEVSLVTKLTRVMLLAPVALLLASLFTLKSSQQSQAPGQKRFRLRSIPIPWFVFGFLLVGAINSFGWLSKGNANLIVQCSTFLMVIAMAAMGLQVDLNVIRQTGFKALGVATLGFALFVGLSFLLMMALHLG